MYAIPMRLLFNLLLLIQCNAAYTFNMNKKSQIICMYKKEITAEKEYQALASSLKVFHELSDRHIWEDIYLYWRLSVRFVLPSQSIFTEDGKVAKVKS